MRVASDGGCEDYVRHGVNGWITPAGDVTALRTAILRMHADPAATRRMGCAGRKILETEMAYADKIDRMSALAVQCHGS